jgi:hypothetical protein
MLWSSRLENAMSYMWQEKAVIVDKFMEEENGVRGGDEVMDHV